MSNMWNDTDIPLAYLITFRCYGTWLHGDERGSIDRAHNRYHSPFIPPSRKWYQHNTLSLKGVPVTLNAAQRESVIKAIRETSVVRNWLLRAMNVRTNHAHVVVSIGNTKPERALNAFKANATRQMRQDSNWQENHSPWADKGSEKFLWNERSIERAIDYVISGQGDELPDFDGD
jgi:REP element-mobilizing transposase RayT